MADYLTGTNYYGSEYMPGMERRRTPRKKLLRRALIMLPGGELLKGTTVDISQGGLSVLIDKPMALNQACAVRFDLFFNGRAMVITGAGKVRNCTLSGLDGFRIGMVFVIANPAVQEFISEFIGPAAAGSGA